MKILFVVVKKPNAVKYSSHPINEIKHSFSLYYTVQALMYFVYMWPPILYAPPHSLPTPSLKSASPGRKRKATKNRKQP